MHMTRVFLVFRDLDMTMFCEWAYISDGCQSENK